MQLWASSLRLPVSERFPQFQISPSALARQRWHPTRCSSVALPRRWLKGRWRKKGENAPLIRFMKPKKNDWRVFWHLPSNHPASTLPPPPPIRTQLSPLRAIRRLLGKDTHEIHTDAAEWVKVVLGQLDRTFQLHGSDLSLTTGRDSTSAWAQIALWLMEFDPRNMPRFLEATHTVPYPPAIYVEDCMVRLTRYWSDSGEPDAVEQLKRLADTFCVVCERGAARPLSVDDRCIRVLMRNASAEQLLHMYRVMKLNHITLHWETHLHFATHFAKNDDFERGLHAFWEAKGLGADMHSYAFRSNCSTILRKSSGHPDGLRLCLSIVSSLVDMGLQLDNPLCDIIMLNAIEAGDLNTAFSVYHSLVDRGLQPTESTFAVLLKGCKMNIDDAKTLTETIQHAIKNIEVRKSAVVATEILHCLALHHSKHNPTTALGTLTEAYAQLFDLRPLKELGLPIPKTKQRSGEFMSPTPNAMNFLIGASIEQVLAHQPESSNGVLALYNRWRNLIEAGSPSHVQLATSDYTANIFLGAFIRKRSGLGHAARVVRDMQRPLPASVTGAQQAPPSVQTWSILLHGFMLHGRTRLAEQVLTHMQRWGVEPNPVTWNTLITGYARVQDEPGVLNALQRAQQTGMVWDEWTDSGLKALQNRGRVDEELAKGRLAIQLDFTEELKTGLDRRLRDVENGDDAPVELQASSGEAEMPGRIEVDSQLQLYTPLHI